MIITVIYLISPCWKYHGFVVYTVENTSNKTFVYSLTMQNNRFNIQHFTQWFSGKVDSVDHFLRRITNILVTISCINDLTYCNVIVHLGQHFVGSWFSPEYTPSLTTYHHVLRAFRQRTIRNEISLFYDGVIKAVRTVTWGKSYIYIHIQTAYHNLQLVQ